MNNLKLYVWEDVLTDYTSGTSGIAFALAESIEQAREIIREKGLSDYGMKDLDSDPLVVEQPEGFYLYGGG